MTRDDAPDRDRTAGDEPAPAGLDAGRSLIDDVDREIVALLAQRMGIVRRLTSIKASLGRPVYDAEREAALLAARRAWAEDHDLDPRAVARIFEAVLELSRGPLRADGRDRPP